MRQSSSTSTAATEDMPDAWATSGSTSAGRAELKSEAASIRSSVAALRALLDPR